MKRFYVYVFVFLISLGSVFAFDVDVNNFSLDETIPQYQNISGLINLSFSDVEVNANFVWGSKKILLENFFERNGVSPDCSTYDCSSSFGFSGSGEAVKNVNLNNDVVLGVVLEGDNINVNGVRLKVNSNFGESEELPLSIKFFERGTWDYSKVSASFSNKNYGCYSSASSSVGPLIRSSYCEKIDIPNTNMVRIGADVSGSDDKLLEMSIYDESVFPQFSCTFNPNEEDSCVIEEEVLEGTYYVCVAPEDTDDVSSYDYKLDKESAGDNCGWSRENILNENSSSDYAIFVKTAKYASASEVIIDNTVLENLVSDANNFVSGVDCSEGCVLPLEISGINQNLVISEVSVSYFDGDEDVETENIYDVDVVSASVEFDGVLNLKHLGFNVGEKGDKSFRLYLEDSNDNVRLIDENIEVLPAPIINSLIPTNFPAGVSIVFSVDVESENNITEYVWNFGEGNIKTSVDNMITYSYPSIGSYDLIVNVTDEKGFVVSVAFPVVVGSPERVINFTLNEKKKMVSDVLKEINAYPSWYNSKLKSLANVSYYDDELKRLEKKYANAVSSSEFLDIAIELQSLKVPYSVSTFIEYTVPLVTDLNKINPEPIAMIAGGVSNSADLSGYKNSIFQWQKENVNAMVDRKEIYVFRDGSSSSLMTIYKIDVSADSEYEAYYAIDKEFSEVNFKNLDSDKKKEGDATVVVLSSGENSFEFYIVGSDDSVMFVSPKLSLLPFDDELGICNSNGVCEEGENSDNCSNDCWPWGWIIFWICMILLFGLVVYTFLQEWYKANYEIYLFEDRRHLFNLLMFIANARARGLKDSVIIAKLREKNWSKEQIVYVIKKSLGKRTGMYELIPIEKLFAWLRNRKAKRNVAMKNSNINKEPPQRFIRRSVKNGH